MNLKSKVWTLGAVGIGPVGIAAIAVVVFAGALAIVTALLDERPPHVPARVARPSPSHVTRQRQLPDSITHPIKPAISAATDTRWTQEAFDKEERMSVSERMKRWDEFTTEASKRFSVPKAWIRAVILAESGGRTMLVSGQPITSSMGAMGLMQLMPDTYDDMRRAQGLGIDPHDPHDNIIAGTAYLHWLHGKYGYPAMFAAYNDGPGGLDQRIANARLLPVETVTYVERVTAQVEGRRAGGPVKFTRPNGTPIFIDGAAVRAVRAALPDEYVPGVKSVITVGTVQQGVREDVTRVRLLIASRGGSVSPKTRTVTRLVLSCSRLDPSENTGRITCSRPSSR